MSPYISKKKINNNYKYLEIKKNKIEINIEGKENEKLDNSNNDKSYNNLKNKFNNLNNININYTNNNIKDNTNLKIQLKLHYLSIKMKFN